MLLDPLVRERQVPGARHFPLNSGLPGRHALIERKTFVRHSINRKSREQRPFPAPPDTAAPPESEKKAKSGRSIKRSEAGAWPQVVGGCVTQK